MLVKALSQYYYNAEQVAAEFHSTYAMGQAIGRGAFCTVSEATRLTDNALCAVKSPVNKARQQVEVILEISILESLEHPNIIKLLDAWFVDGLYTIVVSLHKTDLANFLKTTPRPEMATLRCCMSQLLQALEYIHATGLIHSDVKPSNVLVSPTEEFTGLSVAPSVWLCDFGSAVVGPPGRSTWYEGLKSQWSLAPEICCGLVRYTTAVDIWSAGTILLQMILGRMPFPSTSIIEARKVIFDTVGGPSPATLPFWRSLPDWSSMYENGLDSDWSLEVAPRKFRYQLFMIFCKSLIRKIDTRQLFGICIH